MSLMQVLVAGRREEAQDICSFDLIPLPGSARLPAFSPGSHVDVHVPGGWIRQYSLWNDPAEADIYRIGVLKEASGRGGSRAMHEVVRVGDRLSISQPRNQFALNEDADHSLLLAGGIGVTPIFCMAQVLAARGKSFELHYCARSITRAAFVSRLKAPVLDGRVNLHFDDGAQEQKLHIPTLLKSQSDQSHLYVCGPQGFMQAVLDGARAVGWAEERLHYEFFQAEKKSATGENTFAVRLARSGRLIHVTADQSVVQALAQEGIDIPTSCEQGVCGTCMTKVLSGTPDHRDSFLLPEEREANNCFLACCSRSKTDELELDL